MQYNIVELNTKIFTLTKEKLNLCISPFERKEKSFPAPEAGFIKL